MGEEGVCPLGTSMLLSGFCSSQLLWNPAPAVPGGQQPWHLLKGGCPPEQLHRVITLVQHFPVNGFLGTPPGSFSQYLRWQIRRESYWHRTPSKLFCHLVNHSCTLSNKVCISALLWGVSVGVVAAPNICSFSILQRSSYPLLANPPLTPNLCHSQLFILTFPVQILCGFCVLIRP